MEGKPSHLEVHSLDSAKKKHSVHKKGHHRHPHKSFRDPLLAEEQSHISKGHKKRKEFHDLVSSTLKIPESCDETEQVAFRPPKKKKRTSVSGVDEAAALTCVLVDTNNTGRARKHLRRGVDVIYIDASKEQKAAEEPLSPRKSQKNEAEEQQEKVRVRKKSKKKSKKHRREDTYETSQESPLRSLSLLPELESPQQEPLLPADPGGKMAPLPVSAKKHKSKKKRKVPKNGECDVGVGPASPESMPREESPEAHEAEEGQRKPRRKKKKHKKRKRGSVVDAPLVADGGQAVPEESWDGTPWDPRGCAKPRPQEQSPACWQESVEPAAEEESTLEPAKGPETKYLSEEDSGASCDASVDLDSATKQLQEFIPDIRERAATTIKRLYRDDLGRFKEFKAQGVAIRFGKFSAKENKQLEQNVQEFLSLTGIENADKLLYTDRYPEEKSTITSLKRKYAFRVHIGKGIARPWKLIYYRAKKMFDVNNYKGRYSKGETERLKIYHSLHGNDWKKIGEMVARSSLSVALKFSQINSERNHGTWSKAETQKLIKAVEEVILKKMSPQELTEMDSELQEHPEGGLSIVREKLYKGISWVEVEAKVETRNWMQCKSKWTEILTKRMTNGRDVYRGVNALRAKINLIERLYEINVEDANEVDWEDLASTIGDVPPSYVQTKFYKLKATCVPFWQKKTFPEIIDYLYEISLPLLKEKLEKKMETKGAEVQAPAVPRRVFLFRDIFYHDDSSEGEDAGQDG